MRHVLAFAALLALVACGPLPPSERDAAIDAADAAPTSDAATDVAHADLPTLQSFDDVPADAEPAVRGAVLEYVAGECRVRFESNSFASTGTTVTVRGSVICTAPNVADPLALGVLDPLSLSAIQCSAPRTVYLSRGDGQSFEFTLRSVASGTHAAEFILSNAVRTGGSLVPGEALRRFTVVYATGLPSGANAPAGLGVRQGVTFDDVTAAGRHVLRGVSQDLAPFVSVCTALAVEPRAAALCGLVTLQAARVSLVQRTIDTLIERSSLSPNGRVYARLALGSALLGRSAFGLTQSTRTLTSAVLDASERAVVLSSDQGARAFETAFSAASDLADLLNAGGSATSENLRAESFTTSDGRHATLLHVSAGARMCSTRPSYREASFVIVSTCGNGRCDAMESSTNCAEDCAPPPPATLRVTAPAGEPWTVGERYLARWEGQNLTTPVRIVLRRNGIDQVTATTTGPASGSQWIEVFGDWATGPGWTLCATAGPNGAVWHCSPPFTVLPRPQPTTDAGAPIDVPPVRDVPAVQDVSLRDGSTADVRDAGSGPDVAPLTDVSTADISTDLGRDVLPPPDATAADRIEITLSPAAQRECAGGWTLVLFDERGNPVRGTPGASLVWEVPGTVRGGAIAFGAQCGAGAWRVWSSHLGQTAAQAGVASILRAGVDITARVRVCDPPWHDRAWHIDWRVQPLIGMSPSDLDRCP